MDEVYNQILEKAKNGTLKWVQPSWFIHQRLIEQEFYLRTGSYQWAQVWGGEVQHFNAVKDKLATDYDIIQVNLSGQDLHLPNLIREILDKAGNKHTKIIVNLDYTVELWQASYDYIQNIKDSLKGADMIFGTEHHMSNALELMIGRKVYTSPHPCHVARLKSIRPKRSLPVISTIYHRYDNFTMVPSVISKDLGYKTRLIGYETERDTRRYCTMTMYDGFLGATNYIDFTEQLQESFIVVEPFTLTSHGRSTIDCAAMGVPVVGSNRVESVRRCYPYTCFDPMDAKEGRELVKKLIKDKDFREKVIKTAQENVEYYNHDQCRNRILEFLKEGSYELKPEEI